MNPDTDINLQIQEFLRVLQSLNAGIGLYKASDDLSSWDEIKLDMNPVSPNFATPMTVPCNN
jgi:hypothetical protein